MRSEHLVDNLKVETLGRVDHFCGPDVHKCKRTA